MIEIILIVLIALSFAGLLVYILIRKKTHRPQNYISGQHVFVTNGVNMKTLNYGRAKGDTFPTDQLEKGTVLMEGNKRPLCTLYLFNRATAKEYRCSFSTEVYIGRDAAASGQLCVINIEGDNGISATHCRIRYLNQQLLLDDLNTTNHTYLNGVRVTGTSVISQNDELRIGNTRLIIRYTGIGGS